MSAFLDLFRALEAPQISFNVNHSRTSLTEGFDWVVQQNFQIKMLRNGRGKAKYRNFTA